MSSNIIDIILGVLILLAAFQGFRKGFIVEASSLLALLIGIWAAVNYFDVVADMLVNDMGVNLQNVKLISFLLVFVLVLILVSIIAKIVTIIVKAMALGFINRLAGLLLSSLKVAIVISFFLYYFDQVDENVHIIPEDVKSESKFYRPMLMVTPSILPFINDWSFDLKNRILDKEEDRTIIS